jgi:predicted metalloprotease with PDZ domain
VLPYDRQDVIETMNRVAPYDWAGFFKTRVDEPTAEVTKAGFTLGGYKLVYGETPNSTDKSREATGKFIDQSMGVGLVVNNSSDVQSVVWNSPAFAAGMTVGTKVVAINGEEYSAKLLRAALKDSTDKKHPLSLIIKQGTRYRTITLDYSGGIRYPRLEKAGEGESSLDRLLTPKTGGAPAG